MKAGLILVAALHMVTAMNIGRVELDVALRVCYTTCFGAVSGIFNDSVTANPESAKNTFMSLCRDAPYKADKMECVKNCDIENEDIKNKLVAMLDAFYAVCEEGLFERMECFTKVANTNSAACEECIQIAGQVQAEKYGQWICEYAKCNIYCRQMDLMLECGLSSYEKAKRLANAIWNAIQKSFDLGVLAPEQAGLQSNLPDCQF